MYDLNDAKPQMLPTGDPIPDGTFARIRMTIRPGGVDGSVPMDRGLLKASATSDAKMLDCEFTVLEGPFAKRKFWQKFSLEVARILDGCRALAGTPAETYLQGRSLRDPGCPDLLFHPDLTDYDGCRGWPGMVARPLAVTGEP